MDVVMGSGKMSGFKRFVLWDYPRASWQYDVIVGLIVAFIFLTPRAFFQDQPRAASIVRLPQEQGLNVFWVEPDLLNSVPEAQRGAALEQMLRKRFGKRETVLQLKPISENEQDVKGYMAYTKP
jgi:hypothetical protein